jgi:hypothetical protein
LLISIHIKFNLPFSPPAVVVYTPGQVGSYIVTPPLNLVNDRIHLFYLDRVGPAELGMKIGRIVGYVGEGIINLKKYRVLFGVDVFKSHFAFFPEGHDPITIEGASGIHANGKGGKLSVFTPAGAKEIA